MVEHRRAGGKSSLVDARALFAARRCLAAAERFRSCHGAGRTWWALMVARAAAEGLRSVASSPVGVAVERLSGRLFSLFYWAGEQGVPVEWGSVDDARVIEDLVEERRPRG